MNLGLLVSLWWGVFLVWGPRCGHLCTGWVGALLIPGVVRICSGHDLECLGLGCGPVCFSCCGGLI